MLDSRAAFYYVRTLDSRAMIMRLPGVGSQYLTGFVDADNKHYDGAATIYSAPKQPYGVKRGNWFK